MAGLWSFVRPRPGEDGHHGEEDKETNVKREIDNVLSTVELIVF